jgi:ribosome-associated toxin RatA of RatAB toxin-antitoxin module
VRSEISVRIAAPPALVFRLARDVAGWARLLPHYARVDVLERRPDGALVARMVARRPLPGPLGVLGLGVPVAWRSRTWSEPDAHRLRFVHQGGATNGMDVTWRIEPAGDDTQVTIVTIEHDFRPRFAPWARIVDRAFTRPIAARTLATFRSIAEAVNGTSESPPPTNSPT